MTGHPLVRTLLASAAMLAAVALAGCDTESTSPNAKSIKPIPEKTLAEMSTKKMSKESPLLVRIFKQESELEVWKQDASGRYALLKTYPICRWSGDLGPKIREGDRQAPEGFYTITPAQMNPNSQYYLAFNLGFPNAYDKANDRTGNFLMVHGDCSSAGCYAMTDEQIGEIFALARESFFGGQRSFQIQAYPFRMTAANFAKHRNNPNMPFWRMLKEGSDQFEVTHLEPKVDVCEKRYVFNAQAPAGAGPLSFGARAQCPVYTVPEDIMAAAANKKRADDLAFADLVNHGAKVAPVKMGTDGGMHPVFLAALGKNAPAAADDVRPVSFIAPKAPGTIPPTVNPPEPFALAAVTPDTPSSVAAVSSDGIALPRPAPRRAGNGASSAQVASAGASGSESGDGIFASFSRMVGLSDDAKPAPAATAAKPAARTAAKPAAKAQRPVSTTATKPIASPAAKSAAKPATLASTSSPSGSLGLRTPKTPAPAAAVPQTAFVTPAANRPASAKPASTKTASTQPAETTGNAYTFSSLSGSAPLLPSKGFR